MKDAVRELTQRRQEVFVPLIHRPGEAQVDFGEALVNMNGRLRKVAFMVVALPYSDTKSQPGKPCFQSEVLLMIRFAWIQMS